MALTPLSISTKGLAPAAPLSVTFSNGAGYSVTVNPIRVAPDGTVVVGVPIYLDPSSGKTGSAAVSLVLTQGSQTSAPLNINLQDIPQLSDYGTSLGVISRSFLNYQAIALGRQSGELRAMQASPLNSVDTTREQTNVSKLLSAAIKSRNDIDRVITNTSLAIPIGTLSNGTQVGFDQRSVTMMDRIIGMYLISLTSIFQPNGAGTAGHGINLQAHDRSNDSRRRPKVTPAFIGSALKYITNGNSATGIAGSAVSAYRAESTRDEILAIAGGAATVVAVGAALAGLPAYAAAAGAVGAAIALVSVGNDLYHVASDISTVMNSSAGQPAIQMAYSDMTNQAVNVVVDSFGVALGAVSASSKLLALLTDTNQIALQSGSFIATVTQIFTQGSADQDHQTSDNAANQVANTSVGPGQGFGVADGTVTVSNSQGPVLSGLTGIQLGQPPNTDASAIADPNGNYSIFVPLGSTTINYNNLTLQAIDPISGSTLSSTTVNLDDLNSAVPVNLPTLSGTCVDNDAASPDSDDPDCD